MIPVQASGTPGGAVANGLSPRESIRLPDYAAQLREMMRRSKYGFDPINGCDILEAKKNEVAAADLGRVAADQTLSSYIAKLQRWRESLPSRAVRNELPLSWHTKTMLSLLHACPAILDIWLEQVERGEWLFEYSLRHPYGHFLPEDFAGMAIEEVAEEHPCFEDMIACAIMEGRVVSRDPNDMAWVSRWSQGREKAWTWLNDLPPGSSDPYMARTSVPSVVWSSPEASTQGHACDDDPMELDSDPVDLNVLPNNFLSLSPGEALALAPALRETFGRLNIEGPPRGTLQGCWSMGQLMESSPELRDALADLLLTSRIVFDDIRLHIIVQVLAQRVTIVSRSTDWHRDRERDRDIGASRYDNWGD
ncbi:hypothetical protein PG985_001206 [Apiospora marii]|uniref:Uncharacterized protein n=1 Tax=Apiospora marii TaxID=335849 RepID=A0ABR1RHA8_9PEZI